MAGVLSSLAVFRSRNPRYNFVVVFRSRKWESTWSLCCLPFAPTHPLTLSLVSGVRVRKAWALGPTGAPRASKGSRAGRSPASAPGHLLSLAAGTEDGAALASFPHSFSPLPFHLPLPGPPTPSWLSDPEVRPFLVARFPSPLAVWSTSKDLR